MSWHLENTGTVPQVLAAIDESANAPYGLPIDIAAYLRTAVAACPLAENQLVSIRSTGHRPLMPGSTEVCEVRVVRSGPTRT